MKEVNPKKIKEKLVHSKWGIALVSGLVGAAIVAGVDGKFYQDTTNLSESEIDRMIDAKLNRSKQNIGEDGKAKSSEVNIKSDVSDIAEKVHDAVVSVVNLERTEDRVNDIFGFSKTEKSDKKYKTASEGSGVIYKVLGDKAYIVTNNHVIRGSDALEIILNDGKQVPVELVGADPWTDLAVLAMPSKYVNRVIEFGDSSKVKVGQTAIAIGSPLGSDFASSVTAGIVSGLNRQVPMDVDEDGHPDTTVSAIQTDAAINPGNSGGALVNAAGQLIGINSMKISSAKVEGMGFAIPSNEVQKIISQLEKDGKVIRPNLGVRMASLYQFPLEHQKKKLHLPKEVKDGAVLMDILKGGPADQAGLKVYDVITQFAGRKVTNANELRQALYACGPDDEVEITIYRHGKSQTLQVKLHAQEES